MGARLSRGRCAALAGVALACAVVAAPLAAQPVPVPVAARVVRAGSDSLPTPPMHAFIPDGWGRGTAAAPPRRAPLWAAAASAALPGAGQAMLRQSHGVAYAALEAYMWLEALDSRRFSNRKRDEYREIARTIARRNVPGAKPDGDWDYYERLEKLCKHTLTFDTRCPSSGQYDKVAGGELDPETDVNTYNGQIWMEAVRTYGPNVTKGTSQYALALAEYQRRAEKPEYLWSWVDQQQQYDVYRQAIATSNAKYRDYLHDTHIIIANHVLSMVDAFITIRVRRYGRPGVARERRSGFEASVPWAPFGRPRPPR